MMASTLDNSLQGLSLQTTKRTPNSPSKVPARAFPLRFKRVNEIWDKSASVYRCTEATTLAPKTDDLDKDLFVVRTRIDRKTQDSTCHVDIRSKELQEVLIDVLEDVRGISLKEDEPTVEANLLFSFLPELKSYARVLESSQATLQMGHLSVLLTFIETDYASTVDRLQSLVDGSEITYDLLWALFKPNLEVYTTCPGTAQAMCFRCNYGEEKTRMDGSECFRVHGRHFDYDGKNFGECSIFVDVEKFRGAKRIDHLGVFPLCHHSDADGIRRQLVDCGRKFMSFVGKHKHQQYEGVAFRIDEKGNMDRKWVKSRIVVDGALFWHTNPNYRRAPVDISSFEGFRAAYEAEEAQSEIKITKIALAGLGVDGLILCGPTVRGFSLDDKRWLEFAVINVTDIDWVPSSFDHLSIPPKQKKVVHALCNANIDRDGDEIFDDFIIGKGRGLVILLHGPPGVGKTLTAEAMSEYLQKPLYTLSAGELGTLPESVETRLTTIFWMARQWKAVVLLDEADVFVEQRAPSNIHRNALVSVFLQKLEYYEGILFLTTNRVQTIDEAVESRIHLPLRYKPLGQAARVAVWEGFLRKAVTTEGAAIYNQKVLTTLARHVLNGRQIKNSVSTAVALATSAGERVSSTHLEQAIAYYKEFQVDFRGAGEIENVQSYQ